MEDNLNKGYSIHLNNKEITSELLSMASLISETVNFIFKTDPLDMIFISENVSYYLNYTQKDYYENFREILNDIISDKSLSKLKNTVKKRLRESPISVNIDFIDKENEEQSANLILRQSNYGNKKFILGSLKIIPKIYNDKVTGDKETILSICSYCKDVKRHGRWMDIEEFVNNRQRVKFSHAVCPNCLMQIKNETKNSK